MSSDEKNLDLLINQVEGLGLEEKVSDDGTADEIKLVASWIEGSKNIVIVSGAGVSCSAGIPDFRTPGSGLYDNLQKYSLPYPEAVFDINFYRKKPQPFLNLAKELWPGLRHSPTLTHSFAAILAKRKKLLRNYSQNIDGLEHLASVPEDKIVECHGHFRSASCIRCKKSADSNQCKRTILETSDVPKCKCGGYVKPDIVFFGESLPKRFHDLLSQDVKDVDLLIVMGTSLQVAPVSNIPDIVDCRRVLINRDEVGSFFGENDRVLLGDCDEIVMQLSAQLGWEEDVRALNKRTKIIQKKHAEESK